MKYCAAIVIPTFNGKKWLETSIHDFLNQEFEQSWVILIIDSGSTDGTCEFLAQFGERVIIHQIDNKDFGHGKSRNLALSVVNCDYYLFTVQDAHPNSSIWLANMIQNLTIQNLDALCGRQAVPSSLDNNPAEWFMPIDEGEEKIEVIEGQVISELSSSELIPFCKWDNVNAIYTQDILRTIPFRDIRFAEDAQWAHDCIRMKGRLGYSRNDRVWHYHHHTKPFTYLRTAYVFYARYTIFNVTPPEYSINLLRYLKLLKLLVYHCRITSPPRIVKWLTHNHRMWKDVKRAQVDFIKNKKLGDVELQIWIEGLSQRSPMHKS